MGSEAFRRFEGKFWLLVRDPGNIRRWPYYMKNPVLSKRGHSRRFHLFPFRSGKELESEILSFSLGFPRIHQFETYGVFGHPAKDEISAHPDGLGIGDQSLVSLVSDFRGEEGEKLAEGSPVEIVGQSPRPGREQFFGNGFSILNVNPDRTVRKFVVGQSGSRGTESEVENHGNASEEAVRLYFVVLFHGLVD